MRIGCGLATFSLLFYFFTGAFAAAQHMRQGEPEPPPFGFAQFCAKKPVRCAPADPTAIAITPSRWKELAAINMTVNRSMAPRPDPTPEVSRPWRDDAAAGDCKDYALTKRSQLIDRGWPPSVLLIALAKLPSGEMHAVLVVVTDRGDYVLDNLRYGITAATALPYRWQSIMSPNPLLWHRVITWLRHSPGAIFLIVCRVIFLLLYAIKINERYFHWSKRVGSRAPEISLVGLTAPRAYSVGSPRQNLSRDPRWQAPGRPWRLLTQDIAISSKESPMAENSELRQPTHRVYSIIRGTQGDCLIDIGHVSPRNDGLGYDLLLHAMPEDGELVCRATGRCNRTTKSTASNRPRRPNTKRPARRKKR